MSVGYSQVGQSKNLFCPYTSYLTRAQGVKEFLLKLSETLVEKERLECLLALSICGEMQVVSLVKGEGGSRVFLDTWVLMVSLLCTEVEEYWEEEGMEEENSALSKSFASCKQSMMSVRLQPELANQTEPNQTEPNQTST